MAQSVTFAHRHNEDGTVDSICRRCFLTVATGRTEEELKEAEIIHVCDDRLIANWEWLDAQN